MIDEFLQRHDVDVCRSAAVLLVAGACSDTAAMILQPAFDDTFTLNLSPLLSVWLARALWRRRPWTRKLVIGLGWLAALAIAGATIRVMFFGDISVTAFGRTVPTPTTGQYAVVLLIATATIYVMLRIAHSRKFREEISAAGTPATGVPPGSGI